MMRRNELITFLRNQLDLLSENYQGKVRYLLDPTPLTRGARVTDDMLVSHAVDLYAILGRIQFLISKLQAAGLDVGQYKARGRQNADLLSDLYTEHTERVAALTQQGLNRHFESFEQYIHAIDPAEDTFPFETDHEFETFVFRTREQVLEVQATTERLRHVYDFDSVLPRFSAYDEELRRKIPYCVEKIIALGGRINPAGLYPQGYWWRSQAWEVYRRQTGAEDP